MWILSTHLDVLVHDADSNSSSFGSSPIVISEHGRLATLCEFGQFSSVRKAPLDSAGNATWTIAHNQSGQTFGQSSYTVSSTIGADIELGPNREYLESKQAMRDVTRWSNDCAGDLALNSDGEPLNRGGDIIDLSQDHADAQKLYDVVAKGVAHLIV